ncbi:hypothetical protein [Actinomadura bangladeshensis]|uniref:Secreted protein n=1 Tax=Actinomadura bangladeshensis TaxID=453573 RepID=A0A4R4PCV8_9ACTN|nr:hypothetical protein [Actinomadura bangladeshensis]TDC20315.1 hypothetical protein E1284_00035 [Actinomadura bangladeshensis]
MPITTVALTAFTVFSLATTPFVALSAAPTALAAHGVLAVLAQPNAEPFSPSTARRLLLFAGTAARLVQLAEDRRTTAPPEAACAHTAARRGATALAEPTISANEASGP